MMGSYVERFELYGSNAAGGTESARPARSEVDACSEHGKVWRWLKESKIRGRETRQDRLSKP